MDFSKQIERILGLSSNPNPDLTASLSLLRAVHGEYEEALNSLLIHVDHLETIERRYEQRIPLTIAMREIVR